MNKTTIHTASNTLPQQNYAPALESGFGYSYFGARYYDSDLSIWLSVDPLADEYPSTSPFMDVLGNAIALVNPTGMSSESPDEIKVNIETGKSEKVSDLGGNDVQFITYTNNEQEYLGTDVVEGSTAVVSSTSGGDCDSETTYDSKTDNFNTTWKHSAAWWSNASGRIDYSPVNVEDFIGIGFLIKGGVKFLGKQAAKNILKFRPDIVLKGGRSGQLVKNLTGPANSVIRGGGNRIFITDDAGKVIWDITKDRAKSVIPGKGFGAKVAPTKSNLTFSNKL